MSSSQILRVVSRQDAKPNEPSVLDLIVRVLKPEIRCAIAETSLSTVNHANHAEKSKVVLWVQNKSFAEPKCEYRLHRFPETSRKYVGVEALAAAHKATKQQQSDCFSNPVFAEQWDQSTEETLRFCRETAIPKLLEHLASARQRGVWSSAEMTITFQTGTRSGTNYSFDEGASTVLNGQWGASDR